jgi:hypothetical protein
VPGPSFHEAAENKRFRARVLRLAKVDVENSNLRGPSTERPLYCCES